MDFKGFVDKAKEAATAASEQAKAALNTTQQAPPVNVEAMPQEGGELVPAGETAPAPTKTFAALTGDALNQISAASSKQIQDLITSFQQALPALKAAGYELTEFEVELGVTPKLIPHFKHAAQVAEDVDAAREMLKGNKLGSLLLTTLLKTGDIHRQIKVAGFSFSHIEIELGLVPSVRLQYKNG